MDISLINSNNI